MEAIDGEVELRFLFNGELSYGQRYALWELALATAAAKRQNSSEKDGVSIGRTRRPALASR